MAYFDVDPLLMEKLTLAGTTNADLLSDDEIVRGRALLLDAQHRLQHLSDDAMHKEEHSFLMDTVSTLSIAVAPHKRVPQEILEHIFRAIFPHGRVCTTMPPSRMELPWLLGQVCSHWRRVSRAMSHIWGETEILFDGTDKAILRRVLQVLPEVSKISVKLHDPLYRHLRHSVVPFLHRINKLEGSFSRETFRAFPSNSLSRIESLCLYRFYPMTPYRLFGSSPHLKELLLFCDYPSILLCDVPWGTITSLTLYAVHATANTKALYLWNRVRKRPFGPTSRLTSLWLNLPKNVLPIVLSFDIPWHQLTALTIKISDTDEYRQIIKVLTECTNLVYLSIDIGGDFHSQIPFEVKSPFSLYLKSSWSVPHFIVHSTNFWNNISSLQLDCTVDILSFLDIVSHCNRVHILSSTIESRITISEAVRTIVLPYLQTLTLHIHNAYIFSCLTTPAVKTLTIASARDHHWNGNVVAISDYLTRSGCKVKGFFCPHTDTPSHQRRTPWLNKRHGLKELISCLSDTTSFCAPALLLSADILNDIASCELLPHACSVDIATISMREFVVMVEERLKKEKSEGRVMLFEVRGWSDSPQTDDEKLLARIKEIGNEYGVACSWTSLE